MKVVVYVEGPGDQLCLETLLRPLLRRKEAEGVQITFVPMTSGDRKKALLLKAPIKAANALLNDPRVIVAILPDLYPPNKAFSHSTCNQLREGVIAEFRRGVARKAGNDLRVEERFAVFCLIHDLEGLLLAAEEALLADTGHQKPTWVKPVESQNNENPPKRVVERLLPGYDSKIDGPRILSSAAYDVIAARCPQGFGRFVEFLERIPA